MLVRQIGSVNTLSPGDAQALLSAAGTGGTGTNLNTAPQGSGNGPVYSPANPGAGVTISPTPTPNAYVVTPATDVLGHPLLWAGLGAGAAYLLSKSGPLLAGTVGKKKGSAAPLLIAGGLVAAYFLFGNTASAAAPATDPNRVALTAAYAGQAKQLAVIANASAADLQKWGVIYGIWSKGGDPYAVDTNGNPTTNRSASVGTWWEGFSTLNGF
jgi:hypothetical protein